MTQENFNGFKVGDLVQAYVQNKKSNPRDGEILELHPNEQELPRNYWQVLPQTEWDNPVYFSHALVKFEDGEISKVRVSYLDTRDSDLEREFRLNAPKILKKIDQKISLASKYLAEAEEIAEENGIPFYSNISFLSQGFRPNSFEEKYGEVSSDIVSEITDCHNEYEGWEHSAVCY